MNNYMYLLIGVVIGWIIKSPFLLRWYSELKSTRDYQKAMRYKKYIKTCKKFNTSINYEQLN